MCAEAGPGDATVVDRRCAHQRSLEGFRYYELEIGEASQGDAIFAHT